ncbi:MAG: repressor protein C2 [uncultured bacterium]|nr:MAG: repressor protein C2 [uncultured bacterium]
MAKKYLQLAGILKQLLFDKGMRPVDLAREVNIPAPTIHRLITGKSTRPYRSSLMPIADFFSVTIDQLIGEQPFISLIKKKENVSLFKKILHLPLIPWDELQHPQLIDENKYEKIPFAGNISNQAYATILQDYSMEPLFPPDSMLIFDPEKLFKDRSYVLVQLNETSTPVFRQLLIDLDQKYLKPLNPDLNAFKMRLIGKKDKIIATLVEARQLYNKY